MLYAIFCYHREAETEAWTREEDAACMARLQVVHGQIAAGGHLGPVARLLPTTTATTVRNQEPPLVIDGPFAETKEQLLGFYVVDYPSLDDALEAAKALGEANPGGSYEVRPVALYFPGPPEIGAGFTGPGAT